VRVPPGDAPLDVGRGVVFRVRRSFFTGTTATRSDTMAPMTANRPMTLPAPATSRGSATWPARTYPSAPIQQAPPAHDPGRPRRNHRHPRPPRRPGHARSRL